ncbi:hypothetical protein [Streptosporangium saharense]
MPDHRAFAEPLEPEVSTGRVVVEVDLPLASVAGLAGPGSEAPAEA